MANLLSAPRLLLSRLFRNLARDDRGFIVSVELLLVTVILVIGIIGGMAALRAAVTTELAQLGEAILQLDPGYNIVSVGSTTGSSNGTLVTHKPSSLDVGAANAVATNTTTGTDSVSAGGSFPVPLTP